MMNQASLFSSPNWTVTSITAYLRELFESDEMLRDVWVKGEISNLSHPRSGHIYFTLKDMGKNKLKMKKYNPSTRKHEIFVEKKLPPHSK